MSSALIFRILGLGFRVEGLVNLPLRIMGGYLAFQASACRSCDSVGWVCGVGIVAASIVEFCIRRETADNNSWGGGGGVLS